MKAKELRERSNEELAVELAQMRERLFRLRFRQVAENTSNADERRSHRKDIARVLTIIRERELSGEKEQ